VCWVRGHLLSSLFLATVAIAGVAVNAIAASADEPPLLPIGADAYRMWERWPYQRIGERAYMRSTYDRSGGNDHGDASHFLYQLAEDYNVTLDVEGPGVLYFVRTNHWHGSPWHYIVDGLDHRVRGKQYRRPFTPGQRLGVPAAGQHSPIR
jgi:hypothetical protein